MFFPSISTHHFNSHHSMVLMRMFLSHKYFNTKVFYNPLRYISLQNITFVIFFEYLKVNINTRWVCLHLCIVNSHKYVLLSLLSTTHMNRILTHNLNRMSTFSPISSNQHRRRLILWWNKFKRLVLLLRGTFKVREFLMKTGLIGQRETLRLHSCLI